MSEQKKSAFSKPMNISQALEKIVGAGPLPRTEVAKKVWEYIKKHNRQDQKNKRVILPDDNLAAVFDSKEPIDMFAMTKKISSHLS